ncbi:MAG: hypothetical protein OXB88_06730 [Bacteriovoracales bacterium]|nr:hypothetical protein [Bacteriovoracales bacterium]
MNTYKPPGMSSHDVVRHFKRHLPRPFGKIGHLGTLDPFAEGVLLIATGGAQRMNDLVHEWYPKTYWARGILGVQTPTGDMTVPPAHEDRSKTFRDLGQCSLDFFSARWESFVGEYLQAPPAFSAAKHKGVPLHVWARRGRPVLKEPVKRTVYSLSVERVDFPQVDFVVTVSSGTYIRTLFEDMGKKLGTFGALCQLKRTAIGPLVEQNSLPQKAWPGGEEGPWRFREEDQVHFQLPLPRVFLRPQGALKYGHGQSVGREEVESVSCISKEGPTEGFGWALAPEERLLGLGVWEGFSFRPKVNF